jgi:CRP/FNR family transcriptional regulator, anaerobic regulatory protein
MNAPASLHAVPAASALKVACSSCNLRELCLPVGFAPHEVERLDALVGQRRTVRHGDTLFRSGDPFVALYAVRTGFFKTRVCAEDGRDQVTGFQMAGELLGLDGISTAATRSRSRIRRSA